MEFGKQASVLLTLDGIMIRLLQIVPTWPQTRVLFALFGEEHAGIWMLMEETGGIDWLTAYAPIATVWRPRSCGAKGSVCVPLERST